MHWSNVVARHAAYYPDEIALVRGRMNRTFRELDERANRVANGLIAAGPIRGRRVALLAHNALEFAEIVFGAWKAGASVAPVNFRSTSQEIEHYLRFASAEILLVHEAYLESVLPALQVLRLRKVICFGDGPAGGARRPLPAGVEDYEALLAAHPSVLPTVPDLAEADEAFLIFTSGSTGDPKAISSSHRMQTANATCFAYEFGVKGPDNCTGPADATLMLTPLYHLGAMTFMLSHLKVGAKTVILEQPTFDARLCLEAMSRERITCLYTVNRGWLLILSLPDLAAHDLGAARNLILGSESVPLALIERMRKAFPAAHVSNVYGLSESSGCSVLYLRHKDGGKAPSVGKPFANVWVRVVDDEGRDVVVGAVGEIVVKGDQVVSEYYNNPRQTAESFRNGWFHTGDLATVDDEGFITIAGRKKDMYISGGENIYPLEIEECLFQHPKILEAAVLGVADKEWGEVGVAVVAMRSNETMQEADVLAYLNGRVARYKIPKKVVFVDAIPRTTSGKVAKAELRIRLQSGVPLA